MKIENVLIVDPIDSEYVGNVYVEESYIKHIEMSSKKPQAILFPGFVDIHIHGAFGVDFLTADDWSRAIKFLHSQGVTTFLPTSLSADLEDILAFVERVKDLKRNYPSIHGTHLEGPYISKEKKGAHDEKYIKSPSEEELENLIRTDFVKTITIAPEVFSEEHLLKLIEAGIAVSLGHSNSDYNTALKAIKLGASRITHFPNSLASLHHRNVGIFGAALLENVYVELISDLVHVSSEMINLTVKIKGYDKIILVSDSIFACGLEDGVYEYSGKKVIIRNGTAKFEDGTLIGGAKGFLTGVKNFIKVTRCSYRDLSKVTSYNAANNLRLNGIGRVKEGYLADFVLTDWELNVLEVYKNGERVWGGETI